MLIISVTVGKFRPGEQLLTWPKTIIRHLYFTRPRNFLLSSTGLPSHGLDLCHAGPGRAAGTASATAHIHSGRAGHEDRDDGRGHVSSPAKPQEGSTSLGLTATLPCIVGAVGDFVGGGVRLDTNILVDDSWIWSFFWPLMLGYNIPSCRRSGHAAWQPERWPRRRRKWC